MKNSSFQLCLQFTEISVEVELADSIFCSGEQTNQSGIQLNFARRKLQLFKTNSMSFSSGAFAQTANKFLASNLSQHRCHRPQ
jgi:hypothetical protein